MRKISRRTWSFDVFVLQRTPKKCTEILERACTAIVVLVKPFVKWRSRCRCRRGLLKGCRTLADFFVVELQIFCRGQIGLKFVGPSACRTLAGFWSRLTALRLVAESSKIKMAPIPHDVTLITFSNWLSASPDKLSWSTAH